ncbi:hypothetical protein OPT61_g4450 [Boeremia exigua]|uniref:Uncharacterized protein n=1 Tax=Boeremia exigua TaxID=749465 RepID=A0ACC2IE86_9PLEO|nr:hypothetical protein OPT61_g4450 [Boeremia exigua]
MPQQQHNINALKEAQLQLALQALKQDANLSQRRAAAIYSVPQKTLSDRRAGRPSRGDTMPNSRRLDNNEEQVIVDHILELDARGFGPRLADVAAMANSLRAERNLGPVGTNWPSTFVKRQPELKVKFNRRYDYKRALCEDSGVIQGWFSLVANVKAKYSILDDDVHNFDETGFMMGQISTGAVVTASERRGRPKTVQPGNWEWVTVIQGINAKGWAIPPFIIFKARHHLTGWYKEEDLPQDWVIGVSSNGWTTNELGLEWLKHFDRHTKERTYKKQQGSSPNSVLSALEHYAKGGAILSHKLVLAQQEIKELRAANEAATQRKSHKRKRVQKEGTLIVEDGQRLAALKEFGARGDGKRAKKQVRAQEAPKCGVLGHNGSGFGGVLAKVSDSPVERLACGGAVAIETSSGELEDFSNTATYTLHARLRQSN